MRTTTNELVFVRTLCLPRELVDLLRHTHFHHGYNAKLLTQHMRTLYTNTLRDQRTSGCVPIALSFSTNVFVRVDDVRLPLQIRDVAKVRNAAAQSKQHSQRILLDVNYRGEHVILNAAMQLRRESTQTDDAKIEKNQENEWAVLPSGHHGFFAHLALFIRPVALRLQLHQHPSRALPLMAGLDQDGVTHEVGGVHRSIRIS